VLSAPKNGTQYSRAELITVLSKTCNNPKIRNAWISTILDNKWVPVVKRQIHRLMQKHEQNGVPINQLDKPWHQAGRNPLLQGGFKLVASKALAHAGTRSKFATGKKEEDLRGLRVKLTHTFTATGMSAPVFVSVCSLSERELSVKDCPSGVLILDLAGLCIGGCGVNVGSTLKGCIIFVRNDNDKQTDKVRFRVYRDRVFIPFVETLRADVDGWQKGDPVEDDLRVVSWADGDLAQAATTVEEDNLEVYKDLKILANKQSAARSATEQAVDLSLVFKSHHSLQKSVTLENVDASNCPMKKRVIQGFQEMHCKGLSLNTTKKNALIDFLSCLPESLTKASSRSKVVHGFVQNGLVGDEAKYSSKYGFPDFKLMLDTVRRDVTKEEYNLCESSFPELLLFQMKHGFVEEAEFNRLGYPKKTSLV